MSKIVKIGRKLVKKTEKFQWNGIYKFRDEKAQDCHHNRKDKIRLVTSFSGLFFRQKFSPIHEKPVKLPFPKKNNTICLDFLIIKLVTLRNSLKFFIRTFWSWNIRINKDERCENKIKWIKKYCRLWHTQFEFDYFFFFDSFIAWFFWVQFTDTTIAYKK
jgi:hypothetical protein